MGHQSLDPQHTPRKPAHSPSAPTSYPDPAQARKAPYRDPGTRWTPPPPTRRQQAERARRNAVYAQRRRRPATGTEVNAPGCLIVLALLFFIVTGCAVTINSTSRTPSDGTSSTGVIRQPRSDSNHVRHVRSQHGITHLSDEQIISVGKKSCQRLSTGDTMSDLEASVLKLPEGMRTDTTVAITEGIQNYCP